MDGHGIEIFQLSRSNISGCNSHSAFISAFSSSFPYLSVLFSRKSLISELIRSSRYLSGCSLNCVALATIATSLAEPDRFFLFFFVVAEKGSGNLTIEFPWDEINRFCRALIASDEPKRGANDLCGYVSYCTCHLSNSFCNHTSR